MLVTIIFSFFHNVFKRPIPQVRENRGLFGKGLNPIFFQIPHSFDLFSFSASTNVDLIKALAVILTVVLMPGLFIIICVVSPCRLRSRMWRPSRRTREQIVHSPLRPNSQTSEVRTIPCINPQ